MKKYAPTDRPPAWQPWPRTQKSMVYDAVKAAGSEGIDRETICSQTNVPKQRVWYWLSELRRGGFIKRLGDQIDPRSLSPEDALLFALTAFENALVARAQKSGVTTEMEKAFVRYNKIKSLALGAKTGGEERAALRQAMIDLVKMVVV